MEIKTKEYWSAVGCKLIETFISVKLWILALATFFAFKMVSIYVEMKDVILHLAMNPHDNLSTPELLAVLTPWSSKLLDITLAMFTGVIVVITLSREVFKHAKISESYKFPNGHKPQHRSSESKMKYDEVEHIKNGMI